MHRGAVVALAGLRGDFAHPFPLEGRLDLVVDVLEADPVVLRFLPVRGRLEGDVEAVEGRDERGEEAFAPVAHGVTVVFLKRLAEVLGIREFAVVLVFPLRRFLFGFLQLFLDAFFFLGVWAFLAEELVFLVELPVEGTKEKRWVLICNINPGGPFGGSATQYFVGTFDGKKFTNQFPTKTKWMDYGKDHYATVTFSNAPDGRCVALGWMSNWQYAAVVPTKQYRSANTIARDLTLYRQGGDLLLKSAPSKEIEAARKDMKSLKKFNVSDAYSIDNLLDDNNGAYEIEMEIRNNGAEKIVFTLLNGKGESVKMYYDTALRQFVMDRSVSGETAFSRDFPAMTVAPVPETGDFTLRLFVDRSSIEAFGDGGKFVMTNIVFPSEPYNKMKFESVRGSFTVKKMNVYKLK